MAPQDESAFDQGLGAQFVQQAGFAHTAFADDEPRTAPSHGRLTQGVAQQAQFARSADKFGRLQEALAHIVALEEHFGALGDGGQTAADILGFGQALGGVFGQQAIHERHQVGVNATNRPHIGLLFQHIANEFVFGGG